MENLLILYRRILIWSTLDQVLHLMITFIDDFYPGGGIGLLFLEFSVNCFDSFVASKSCLNPVFGEGEGRLNTLVSHSLSLNTKFEFLACDNSTGIDGLFKNFVVDVEALINLGKCAILRFLNSNLDDISESPFNPCDGGVRAWLFSCRILVARLNY